MAGLLGSSCRGELAQPLFLIDYKIKYIEIITAHKGSDDLLLIWKKD